MHITAKYNIKLTCDVTNVHASHKFIYYSCFASPTLCRRNGSATQITTAIGNFTICPVLAVFLMSAMTFFSCLSRFALSLSSSLQGDVHSTRSALHNAKLTLYSTWHQVSFLPPHGLSEQSLVLSDNLSVGHLDLSPAQNSGLASPF